MKYLPLVGLILPLITSCTVINEQYYDPDSIVYQQPQVRVHHRPSPYWRHARPVVVRPAPRPRVVIQQAVPQPAPVIVRRHVSPQQHRVVIIPKAARHHQHAVVIEKREENPQTQINILHQQHPQRRMF